jgi:cysteine-rich repeat protein
MRIHLLLLCASCSLVAFACGDDSSSNDDDGGGNGGSGAGGASGGSGGSGGAGGSATTCGDGNVDAGEECDDGEATARCDDDCTAPACGDGTHNPAASERCDDGNMEEGDACSAACEPTVVVLTQSFPSSTSDAIALASTGDVFSVVWVVNGADDTTLNFATLGAEGVSAQTPLLTADAGSVTIGSDPTGRAMIFTGAITGATVDLGWRFVSPGGTLEAGEGSSPDTPFGIAGNPVGKLFATEGGLFCALGGNGDLRCGDDTTAFGPPVSVSSSVHSSHMLRRGDGLFASFLVEGAPYEFHVLEIGANGAPVGDSQPLAGADANSYATGGVSRPDGTFGFALSTPGSVKWYPFHADGVFDATNVTEIGTSQTSRAKLVAIPSGRFLLVWYEALPPGGQTCPLVGRLFDENVEPLGEPVVLYEAPMGRCAARYDVAVSPEGDVALAWNEYVQGGTYGARALFLPKYLVD